MHVNKLKTFGYAHTIFPSTSPTGESQQITLHGRVVGWGRELYKDSTSVPHSLYLHAEEWSKSVKLSKVPAQGEGGS